MSSELDEGIVWMALSDPSQQHLVGGSGGIEYREGGVLSTWGNLGDSRRSRQVCVYWLWLGALGHAHMIARSF